MGRSRDIKSLVPHTNSWARAQLFLYSPRRRQDFLGCGMVLPSHTLSPLRAPQGPSSALIPKGRGAQVKLGILHTDFAAPFWLLEEKRSLALHVSQGSLACLHKPIYSVLCAGVSEDGGLAPGTRTHPPHTQTGLPFGHQLEFPMVPSLCPSPASPAQDL